MHRQISRRWRWLCFCLLFFCQSMAKAEPIVAGSGWNAITVGKDFSRLTEEIGPPENVLSFAPKGVERCYAQYLEGRIEAIFQCQDRKILTIYFYAYSRPWVNETKTEPTPAKNLQTPREIPRTGPIVARTPSVAQNNLSNFRQTMRSVNSPTSKVDRGPSSPSSPLPAFTGTIEGAVTLASTIETVMKNYGTPKAKDRYAIHYDGISFFPGQGGKIDRLAVYEKGRKALSSYGISMFSEGLLLGLSQKEAMRLKREGKDGP